MFSEYASRFLAQSQSRISSSPQPPTDNPNDTPRGISDRHRRPNRGSRYPTSRSYLSRTALGNPYQVAASHFSQLPFASRTSTAPAPLFYSATDEFREEDDEAEREREAADLYALQRSRRHFGAARLAESSETDGEGSRGSEVDANDGRGFEGRGYGIGRGIKSSWRGDKTDQSSKGKNVELQDTRTYQDDDGSPNSDKDTSGAMVDIELESSQRENATASAHNPHSRNEGSIKFSPDDPPAFQQFRNPPADSPPRFTQAAFLPYETPPEAIVDRPRPPSSDTSSVPPSVSSPAMQPPRHDPFWSSLFFISFAALFATFFLVYLHTSAPSRKHPLGDTIYTTLRSSFHLLAVDTLVAIVVSLLWLSLLRSFVRPLTYIILIAVPIIFTSFSIYPFVASFQGPYHGSAFQDRMMRWLSILPAVATVLWSYSVYRARHSLRRAIDILEFTCRILAANPALLALGLATLAGVVLWTWVWMGMFTRVFLGGHLSRSKNVFVIDFGTWWLGVYFVLMYLWTLSIGSGIQRATTAATVSQWYFHRLAVPAPTSQQVVTAALNHACFTGSGTICLSTLMTLLVRLPLLLLPVRIVTLINMFAYTFIPTSITTLTNPLTLTHAAIHSQSLNTSAKALGQHMSYLSYTPTTTLHYSSNNSTRHSPLTSYRLAKLLLHATRFIMSLTLGFGGWISTARSLAVRNGGNTVSGSLYAYVVGLIAGAIGWGVLGAMEGVIGGVLDGVLVCWTSESKSGNERGRYCLEAEYLFGGGGGGGGRDDLEA
ncbi:MAG: hypothetical protein M1816_002529 [Peltula sp. TS41687]|nr:MAG: hypothetical protein M1816_002529 [Peltula sp. TS41687]